MTSSVVTVKTGAVCTTFEESTRTCLRPARGFALFFAAEGFVDLLRGVFLLVSVMRTLYTNRVRAVLLCCS